MTSKKHIRWGIIGLGKIAHKFASDLNLSEHAVLYGVASRDLERAQKFSKDFNSTSYFNSYEELAQDPEIDVVYIATPHSFHFEHTMMCLRNGKSVLCEKPMAVSQAEVKMMIHEARSRNLFLMEGIWTRFIPATEMLIQLLREKAIGDVLFIRADFGFKAEFDPESRVFNKSLGGGSLLDIGIYPIYLSLLVLGMPATIKAMARMTETGVDSYCAMLFNYKNSAKAMLDSTIEANTPTEAYIYGTKGYIKLHRRFHHTEKISLVLEGKQEQNWEVKYRGEGYYHEIEEVNSCIRNKEIESKKLPHRTSLKLMNLIDQVKAEIRLNY